jgi:NitT/TauT family transport system ATP-binding protein
MPQSRVRVAAESLPSQGMAVTPLNPHSHRAVGESTDSGSAVTVENVDLHFAGGMQALMDVSLTVRAGEFVCVVGPSGCGKSSLLRLIAGLQAPSGGRVHSRAVAEGACGFVFQDPTLMPWASVFDNVWLPLRLRGVDRLAAQPAIMGLLQGLGLADFAQALPAELSGGMRMRTSIARALSAEPQLLLMDEPFAALDEFTRQRLNVELLEWWQARNLTLLFVTHGVSEAIYLAQRIVVMSARPGRIVDIFENPEPYPRAETFRDSSAFQQLRRDIVVAMEAAQHVG